MKNYFYAIIKQNDQKKEVFVAADNKREALKKLKENVYDSELIYLKNCGEIKIIN